MIFMVVRFNGDVGAEFWKYTVRLETAIILKFHH